MKLKKIIKFSGKIICKTGLHIGGVSNEINIGGIDSEVIKNPVTSEPYIPGSSLKGKMRSQLEKKYGRKDRNGNDSNNSNPCMCGKNNCLVCRLFGAHFNTAAESAPTRIIVRDSSLSNMSREEYSRLLDEKNLNYLEVKGENIINRKNGTAENPRFIERVPAGAEFDMEILLQIFEHDNENELLNGVKEGLTLVEKSYLGGAGSRGYGQCEFKYTISE